MTAPCPLLVTAEFCSAPAPHVAHCMGQRGVGFCIVILLVHSIPPFACSFLSSMAGWMNGVFGHGFPFCYLEGDRKEGLFEGFSKLDG
jgi:hypothetical protein